ncbi:S8 family serine peptidase [Pontibacter cellulosilyticus]|uniref:S8 family serine peptidase n=1 Tax=Pontibacter cellulosilyticus TaxID=1720253 RepID=A0A923N560_9BACT|nr:S8 family serine peptidase [Pontibacter cellulosilyticus]MBC5991932.1 S8 family serine peptidase [Pontibacter cellulosilyticus]
MRKDIYLNKSLKPAIVCIWVVAAAFTISSCEKGTLEEVAPLSSTSTNEAQGLQENGAVIPGKYIVVFKDDADFGLSSSDNYERRQAKMRAASQALLRGKGIASDKIDRVFGTAIKGMAVGLSIAELQQLRRDPRVAYIEQDRVIKLAPPAGKGPKDGGSESTQDVPWGIQRVGGPGNGAGKTAWVLDSGIDLDHPDLNVDVTRSMSVFTSDPDLTPDDKNGHGTHVAGTIAAKNNNVGVVGVAADATVVAVKVLDYTGSGTYSGVTAGVDYVAANGASGDVANMSLGGPPNQAFEDAVLAASAIVKFTISAGNDGEDANNYSPARVNGPNIFTISAINSNDWLVSWSNWGNPPIDYAAPGYQVLSSWNDGGYRVISGTSMAAPHVAGLLLLGELGFNCYALGDPDGNPDPIAYRGDKKCNSNGKGNRW